MFKYAFGVPIGALLLAFAHAASAAPNPIKATNQNGASSASSQRGLARLGQWALVLGAFGLTGTVLRSQKPRNNLS